MSTHTDCAECNDHIATEIRYLEANVDRKYLMADSYQTAIRGGIGRCSVHGNDFYRAPVPSGEVETPCATCGDEGFTLQSDGVVNHMVPCPDCGVETPEAAGRIAQLEDALREVLDSQRSIFVHYARWMEDGDSDAAEAMDRREKAHKHARSLLAGWTPPGGP